MEIRQELFKANISSQSPAEANGASLNSNAAPGIDLTQSSGTGIQFTKAQTTRISNQWDAGINEASLAWQISQLPTYDSDRLNLDSAAIIKAQVAARPNRGPALVKARSTSQVVNGGYGVSQGRAFGPATGPYAQSVLNETQPRTNLQRAIYERDKLNAGYIGPVENLEQLHTLVMSDAVSNIQEQLNKGNTIGVWWEAAKGATYDMLAPQGTVSAAMLVTGGPLLRGVGKSVSAAFPTASAWVVNVANKPISSLHGEAVSGVKSLVANRGLSLKPYSGDVYSADFVGPVNWQTFYRGDSTRRVSFLSSMAEEQGVSASRFNYLNRESNGLLDDLFDYHGNVGSQGLPTIGVSTDRAVAEYFARGPRGNQAGFVTEFKMQRHEFESLAKRNYENRRDVFDINPNIGKQEQEWLFNSFIPDSAVVKQWQVN